MYARLHTTIPQTSRPVISHIQSPLPTIHIAQHQRLFLTQSTQPAKLNTVAIHSIMSGCGSENCTHDLVGMNHPRYYCAIPLAGGEGVAPSLSVLETDVLL